MCLSWCFPFSTSPFPYALVLKYLSFLLLLSTRSLWYLCPFGLFFLSFYILFLSLFVRHDLKRCCKLRRLLICHDTVFPSVCHQTALHTWLSVLVNFAENKGHFLHATPREKPFWTVKATRYGKPNTEGNLIESRDKWQFIIKQWSKAPRTTGLRM